MHETIIVNLNILRGMLCRSASFNNTSRYCIPSRSAKFAQSSFNCQNTYLRLYASLISRFKQRQIYPTSLSE